MGLIRYGNSAAIGVYPGNQSGNMISYRSAGGLTGSGPLLPVLENPPVGLYPLPGDFTNPMNATVSYDGSKWITDVSVDDIDFTLADTHIKYYVDWANGADGNDGLSPGAAKKTFNNAINTAEAGGVAAEIIILDEWTGWLSIVAAEQNISIDLKVRSGSPSGITRIRQNREDHEGTFGWVNNGDGTFTSTANGADWRAVFDDLPATRDEYGIAVPFKSVVDQAECAATPGSWYFSSPNVTVHMPDGREPDGNLIYCGSNVSKMRITTAKIDGILIFENLICYSNNGVASGAALSGRCDVSTGKNPNTARCGVKNCGGAGATGNSIEFWDFNVLIVENCTARYSQTDGFNYHIVGSVDEGGYMTVYEIDCVAKDVGYPFWRNQPVQGISNNGSSAHDHMSILRVNTLSDGARGPVIADVNGCDSMNFGCKAERPNLNVADLAGTTLEQRKTNAPFYFDQAIVITPDHPERCYLVGCFSANLTDGDAEPVQISNDGSTLLELRVDYWTGIADENFDLYGIIKDIDGNVLSNVT